MVINIEYEANGQKLTFEFEDFEFNCDSQISKENEGDYEDDYEDDDEDYDPDYGKSIPNLDF